MDRVSGVVSSDGKPEIYLLPKVALFWDLHSEFRVVVVVFFLMDHLWHLKSDVISTAILPPTYFGSYSMLTHLEKVELVKYTHAQKCSHYISKTSVLIHEEVMGAGSLRACQTYSLQTVGLMIFLHFSISCSQYLQVCESSFLQV